MNIKSKLSIELLCMLLAMFLIVFLFANSFPFVFSSDVSIPIKILFELSPYVLMIVLVMAVSKFKKRSLSASLGLKKGHVAKQFFIAAIIFLITISFIVIPLLSGADKNNVLNFKASSQIIFFYYIVKDMVFVGMGEEIVWRGYFYERLIKLTGSGTWAAVLSSILFGLWYYPNGQDIMQVVMTTILGLIYGFARLKVKNCSVLATGIAHGLHDSVIMVLSYLLL